MPTEFTYYEIEWEIVWNEGGSDNYVTEFRHDLDVLPQWDNAVKLKYLDRVYDAGWFRTRADGEFKTKTELNFDHIKRITKLNSYKKTKTL